MWRKTARTFKKLKKPNNTSEHIPINDIDNAFDSSVMEYNISPWDDRDRVILYENTLAMDTDRLDFAITDRLIDPLLQYLNKHPEIIHLYISNANITTFGLNRFLDNNRTIIDLHINDSNLTSDEVALFENNTIIKELHLMSNNINDSGAESLSKNKSIVNLNLGDNKIGDIGAESLSKNKTIKKLNLAYNNIGDIGAISLAKNKTIRKLSLDHNHITNIGALSFLENISLTYLDIRYNVEITDDVYYEVVERIKNRQTILASGRKKLQTEGLKRFTAKAFSTLETDLAHQLGYAYETGRAHTMGFMDELKHIRTDYPGCMSAMYQDADGNTFYYTKDQLYYMAKGLGLSPNRKWSKEDLCFLLSFHGGALDCDHMFKFSKHKIMVLAEGLNIEGYELLSKEELCEILNNIK